MRERDGQPGADREAVIRAGRRSLSGRRLLGYALVALLIGGAFVAGWFIALAVDEDDQRLADARAQLADAHAQLANTKGQVDTLEDELEASDERVSEAEETRAELEAQVEQLTGEEPSAGLGLPENVKAISKGNTLKLEELEATLVGFEVTDTVSDEFDTQRADGKFLTASVTIKNRLDSPQSLDPEQHFSLIIGSQNFTPDFDAMNYAGGESSWLDVGLFELQPGTSKTGTVTFDVSPEAAEKASKGVLLVVQFSDASGLGFEDAGFSLPVAGLKLN